MNITEAIPALTAFLLARIAEDEEAARAASPGRWTYPGIDSISGGSIYDETRVIANVFYESLADHDGRIVRHLLSPEADANGQHIVRHDPARVLAECEAKRRIIELRECFTCDMEGQECTHQHNTLVLLAQVYSDHLDFDPAWAISE